MRTSRLIKADTSLSFVYSLVKSLTRLAPVSNHQIREVYVLKFFGLGSIIRIDHVIQNLSESPLPYKLITFDKNKEICSELGIDAVFVRSGPAFVWDTFALIGHVWKKKGVRVVDFERSSNLVGVLREILSIGKPQVSCSFTDSRSDGKRQVIHIKGMPAVEVISRAFSGEYKADVAPRINQSDAILININSGDYITERRFPLQKFARVIAQIHDRYPSLKLYLTGAPSERDFVESFISEFDLADMQVHNVAGVWSLTRLMDEMKKARFVLTNDSSPLHLANYLRVPCVVLWGPTSPELVGYPDSGRMLNIYAAMDCSPCFEHPKSKVALACQGKLDCFEKLNDMEVSENIVSFIKKLEDNS